MVRPLKRARTGHLLQPLNAVFAAPSHVAILRALAGAASGLTGREVSREAGIAPRAALQGLDRLRRARLLRRQAVGKAYLFSLNRELPLLSRGILPLLERELDLRARVIDLIQKACRGRVLSAVLYGSAARGQDRPDSDLDLLLLVEGEAEKEALRESSGRLLDDLAAEGVAASPIFLTRREFASGFRRKQPFFRSVASEGLTLVGRPLQEVLHDQAK